MSFSGCPGSPEMTIGSRSTSPEAEQGSRPSQLRQWPVQLHLVSPEAPYFQEADVLLSADCVAYATGDFHKDFLKGKVLAIACPKLDSNQDVYLRKLIHLFEEAKINTLTVAVMQVPCCSGLVATAKEALEKSSRKVPTKVIVVSLEGEVLADQWL